MAIQNYSNHRRFVPLYNGFLTALLFLSLIGSFVNLYESIGNHERLYNAALIVAIMAMLFILAFYARTFALKAQDRAIRAEENLRHYVLTGRLLDPSLSFAQIAGLRFASDEEFPALAKAASEKNLSADEIKRAVKHWRPDLDRV